VIRQRFTQSKPTFCVHTFCNLVLHSYHSRKHPNKIFYVGDTQKIITIGMKIFITEMYSSCSKLACNLG